MEKFKKLTVIAITALLLTLSLTPAFSTVASAEDTNADIGTDISTILNYFGYDMTPEGTQKLLDDIQNGGIGSIIGLLGFDVNDIIHELQTYLNNFEAGNTTTAPTAEITSTVTPSTDAPSTDAPSTDAPSTDAPSTDAPTRETTTAKPVSPPSYSSGKPATNSKNENTTTPVTEEDTAEISSEEVSSDEVTTTVTNTEKPSDDFFKTVLIVFLTMAVFIVGIATGITITKKPSSTKKEEP